LFQMTSIDPFLDQEYEEDDDMDLGGFGGLAGGSSQPLPQSLQYASVPSSSYTSSPNVYYPPSNFNEIAPTSFYGQSQPPQLHHQPPLGGGYITAIHHPNQPIQYMPGFDSMQHLQQPQQQQVFFLQQPNGGVHQMVLQPSVIVSAHQQQQYQFEQHQELSQHVQSQQQLQPPQSSASDHSYASYTSAAGLYDDGTSDSAPRNFSSADKQVPVLRDPVHSSPIKAVAKTVHKKRPPIEKRVGETDSASAAAVRRISTEEGWKSMNGWLKAAEQDTNKLLQLLGQCREAKVTVTLLRSNDTPKFIRKLSKNHEDGEVRALSLSIVNKWKKVVNTPDVVEEKKEKKPKKEEEDKAETDENEEMKTRSEPVVVRRRSSDEGLPKEKKEKEPKKDKEHRAKAKVYQSKGRSTGLEGDDDAAPAKQKRAANDTSPVAGVPPAKKSSTEKAPVGSAASSATTPPQPKRPLPVKKVTTSSSFMDSLLGPAVPAQSKKRVLQKKPIPRPEVKIPRPVEMGGDHAHEAPRGVVDLLLSPNSDGKVAMEGLFADTSRSLKEEKAPSPSRVAPAPAIFVAEEPEFPAGRRIRFADEKPGGELVEIRFFEIEEGERINVNRYTPEEMKHHEAIMEKEWKKESANAMNEDDDMDEEGEDAGNPWMMPGQPAAPAAEKSVAKWRFVQADWGEEHTAVDYGKGSQMKVIQEERQKNAMMAFYNPNERCSFFDEPENHDVEPAAAAAGLRLRPVIIPAEMTPYEEDEGIDGVAIEEEPAAPAEPAQPAVTDRLKALINGLKSNGLLHDGSVSAAATSAAASPSDPFAAAVAHQPVAIPTTSTYYQEPTGTNGFGQQPNRAHHMIQQEFPGQMQQMQQPMIIQQQLPQPVPGTSGIQVVNMDVHGPGAVHDAGAMPHDAGMGVGGGMGAPGNAPFPPYHPGPGRPFYVSQRPCTFFNSPRGCKFGDRCGFAHIPMDGAGGPPPGGPMGQFRGRGGPMGGGMRGGGDFRGGPRGGPFRGRGGFGGPPPGRGDFGGRDAGGRDIDFRNGRGSWRDERRGGGDHDRRERRRSRSRSRSPSPSRRSERREDRDRDYRGGDRDREREERSHRSSSRRGGDHDVDMRKRDEEPETSSRSAAPPTKSPVVDDDDIDGVPIGSPKA
ncbi:hypothetical protein PFISCL1PPCAC_22734, partial [Pristionchus fissidentatus]